MATYFCVLDLETTGLDDATEQILEMGAILLDENLDEVSGVRDFHAVCEWDGDPQLLDPVVQNMHTENGLFDECASSRLSVDKAVFDFQLWIEDAAIDLDSDAEIYLTGNNIKFDIGFLNEAGANLSSFHYRSVDISSLKVLINTWVPNLDKTNKPIAKKLHRSISDCYDSIAELQFYMHAVFS